MASFDLVGKLTLKFEQAEIAKIERKLDELSTKGLERALDQAFNNAEKKAERMIASIEKDMARLARVANNQLTKAFDNIGKNASKSLEKNILQRDKFSSQQGSRANKLITSGQTSDIEKNSKALRENILLRDRFITQQATDANALITSREEQLIRRQSDALRENILLRDQFITQQAQGANRSLTSDFNTRNDVATQSLKERILKRDQFLSEQAAIGNRALNQQQEIADQKRITSLREAIQARHEYDKAVKAATRNNVGRKDEGGAFAFGQQSALAFKRFAAFSLSAGAVFGVIQAFREGITEAIGFEQELVKLAQVSNSSVSALKKTQDTISGLATSLGTSSKDLAVAAVTIRQAGFSIEETNAALESLALTTLSPSFNDIGNTTEGLIALKSQFNAGADDFKQQLGEINSVSKAFAVESEDIITTIRKSGGAFKVAGGDVRELVALFTAVRATTRESADTISTGFRTIFGRLQRPQVLDELKSFNIELRNTEGNFVGPFEAIQKINEALSSVGQEGNLQFSRVAEQIGGIRQISKVIPLIQQYALAQRAANIALLGQNSLQEDADIAQQSFANRLTKTKEKFLEFARSVTINNQFKDIANGILTIADAVTTLARAIGPVLPTLSVLLGLGQLKNLGNFARGFNTKLFGEGIRGPGLGLALSGAFGGGIRDRIRTGSPTKNLGLIRKLNTGVGLAGVGLGVGAIALGGQLSSNPLQKNKFAGGRALTGAATGAFGGGLLASSFGVGLATGPGALIIGLAAAGAAAYEFKQALDEAQDALEESKFRPIFDRLSETLQLVNTGRIGVTGRAGDINSGLQALRERRLTATGVEREQLRGDIRQTVESLLLFQQTLLENVKTMEEFKAAGGNDAIKFISENSVLTQNFLKKQAKEALDVAEKSRTTLENVAKASENLLTQTNLVNAFGQALEDATVSINDSAGRFSFLSNNAFGNNIGVGFRGTRGFGSTTNNPRLLSQVGRQVSGLIGLPQFQDLGDQAAASANIRRQLPGIISEFGIRRPAGGINEEFDTFVRKRLEILTKQNGSSAITVGPIIDSVVGAISNELATQGKGQSNVIDEIISKPLEFVDKVFSEAGLDDQIGKLIQNFSQKFTEVTNRFADQLGEVMTNEINIRQELATSLQKQSEVLVEIARRRNPRDFPLWALRAGRLAQANALLGRNAGAIGGNPDNALTFIRNANQLIKQKELDLQQAKEVSTIKTLTEQIIALQGEVILAKDAFGILIDNSDEVAAKFAEIDKIQIGRDQLRNGVEQFLRADRAGRNQLNLTSAAAQLSAINPDNFFNPAVIPDTLRSSIIDFFDQFSDRDIVPGISGRTAKQNLINRQAQLGGANANVIQNLQEGPNTVQRKLLDEAQKLADDELKNRAKFLTDQQANNKELNAQIAGSLSQFITDLRSELLTGVQQSTQNRLGAVGVSRSKAQEQIRQFELIRAAGGSVENNLGNKDLLELAKEVRKNQSAGRAASDIDRLINRPNAFGVSIAQGKNRPFNPSFERFLAETGKKTGQTRQGNPIFGPLLTEKAAKLGTDVLDTILPDLKLSASEISDFKKKLTDNISDAAGGGPRVGQSAAREALFSVLEEAAKKSRTNSAAESDRITSALRGRNPQEQAFFGTLLDLNQEKFNELATAINSLGDSKLSTVTEQFNKLNLEADALRKTLEGLTGQLNVLNGGNRLAPQAAPQGGGGLGILFQNSDLGGIFQGITQSISTFVNGSAPMTQALNNFPRSVEMQGTHTVNVNLNGAQVLQNIMPSIQSFVTSEIEKGISDFASKNLPGVGAY